MPTLNQSFSATNFNIIFNLMNRKGKIDVYQMSAEYQQIINNIRNARNIIRNIRNKKKSTWTDKTAWRSARTCVLLVK